MTTSHQHIPSVFRKQGIRSFETVPVYIPHEWKKTPILYALFDHFRESRYEHHATEGFRFFLVRYQNCEKRNTSFMSVRPSVRMEQLGSHWTDFHEIWYSSIFRKSDKNI